VTTISRDGDLQTGDGRTIPARVPGKYRVWDTDGGETVAEGTFVAQANQNWQVARIRIYATDRRMVLIEWEAERERFGNHYLAGSPPFSLAQYRAWLPIIAALPRAFDAEGVAR